MAETLWIRAELSLISSRDLVPNGSGALTMGNGDVDVGISCDGGGGGWRSGSGGDIGCGFWWVLMGAVIVWDADGVGA